MSGGNVVGWQIEVRKVYYVVVPFGNGNLKLDVQQASEPEFVLSTSMLGIPTAKLAKVSNEGAAKIISSAVSKLYGQSRPVLTFDAAREMISKLVLVLGGSNGHPLLPWAPLQVGTKGGRGTNRDVIGMGRAGESGVKTFVTFTDIKSKGSNVPITEKDKNFLKRIYGSDLIFIRSLKDRSLRNKLLGIRKDRHWIRLDRKQGPGAHWKTHGRAIVVAAGWAFRLYKLSNSNTPEIRREDDTFDPGFKTSPVAAGVVKELPPWVRKRIIGGKRGKGRPTKKYRWVARIFQSISGGGRGKDGKQAIIIPTVFTAETERDAARKFIMYVRNNKPELLHHINNGGFEMVPRDQAKNLFECTRGTLHSFVQQLREQGGRDYIDPETGLPYRPGISDRFTDPSKKALDMVGNISLGSFGVEALAKSRIARKSALALAGRSGLRAAKNVALGASKVTRSLMPLSYVFSGLYSFGKGRREGYENAMRQIVGQRTGGEAPV